MTSIESDFDLIENYINGQLKNDDLDRLEQRIETDDEFRWQVAYQIAVRNYFEEKYAENALIDTLSTQIEKQSKPTKLQLLKFIVKRYATQVALVFIAIGIGWWVGIDWNQPTEYLSHSKAIEKLVFPPSENGFGNDSLVQKQSIVLLIYTDKNKVSNTFEYDGETLKLVNPAPQIEKATHLRVVVKAKKLLLEADGVLYELYEQELNKGVLKTLP